MDRVIRLLRWGAPVRITVPEAVGLIQELGRSGEPGVVVYLLEFTRHDEAAVRLAASDALELLFSIVPEHDLPQFDLMMREPGHSWEDHDQFWQIQPAEVAKFPQVRGGATLLRLASMHRNGRVRMAALELLAAQPGGAELPFFLLRLNDWVEPIREWARGTIEARLATKDAGSLLAHVDLIAQIDQGRRADHRWLREALAALLVEPPQAERAGELLRSASSRVRKFCAQVLFAPEVHTPDELVQVMLKSPDPAVRARAAERALHPAAESPEEFVARCRKLAQDKFMPVRRVALRTLVAKEPLTTVQTDLKCALLDRQGSMRELARYYLRGVEGFDPAAWYREEMSRAAGATLALALLGLGESGGRADAALLQRFLSASLAKVRVAAIRAIARLDASGHVAALFALVVDGAPSVSTAAARALEPSARLLDRGRLRELAISHPASYVRRNALRLVNGLGKWEKVPILLAGCRNADKAVAALARGFLRVWLDRYNRSYVAATPELIAEASFELQQNGELLRVNEGIQLWALFESLRRTG